MKSPIPKNLAVRSRYATIDWITMTARDRLYREEFRKRFELFSEGFRLLGEKPKPWKFCGYTGLQVGSIRYGVREDSAIIVLSGSDAATLWRVFAPHMSNCTRVDLAVTCETSRCYNKLLATYYQWIRQNGLSSQRKHTLIQNTGRGQTLYVGSRTSDEFGRVYDKAAERGDPLHIGRWWRYEVEYKGEMAKILGQELLGAEGDKALPGLISDTVYAWFNRRDIPPIWQKDQDGWLLEREAKVTDASRSLTWLTTQVKPTVMWLVQEGWLREVLKALELGGLAEKV